MMIMTIIIITLFREAQGECMSLCTCARIALRGEFSCKEYLACHMPVGLTSTITVTVNTVHSL